MAETLVWISGATGGLGLGLARHVPYADARIVNISRRQHPDYETLIADIADPAGWQRVREHFARELAGFAGSRAIFIHNAYSSDGVGLIGTLDSASYQSAVLANAAAPLVLGEAFLSAARHLDCEVGLVLMSSGATTLPIEGLATYAAAKIGVEYWADVVSRELAARRPKCWVTALRPGGIDTPGSVKNANLPRERWPFVEVRREMHKQFMDIDTAGRLIWSALPPPPGICLLSVGPPMTDRAEDGFGARVRYIQPPQA
jgi:benzil reductase ((S)-benzoin forming)